MLLQDRIYNLNNGLVKELLTIPKDIINNNPNQINDNNIKQRLLFRKK